MTVAARTEPSDAVGTTGNSAGRAAGSGRSPLPWIVLLWGGWALVYGTRLRWVIPGADWSQAFAYALPEALIWALLTPGIMIVSRRWPVPGSSPRTAAIVHLTVGCLVSFLQPLLHGVLEWTFGGGNPWTYATYALPHRFQANLVLYAVIVLGLSWREERARRIVSQLRGAELRAQLDRARLSALRAQIRPHFVLNCLHSISSLAASSPR